MLSCGLGPCLALGPMVSGRQCRVMCCLIPTFAVAAVSFGGDGDGGDKSWAIRPVSSTLLFGPPKC